ncbi:MAG TPA: hypothetical protein VE967_14565 [Gemmatimonadaceae bacterium]|nr:hypothetical protein [Gemmatimonadaceae bacterium]
MTFPRALSFLAAAGLCVLAPRCAQSQLTVGVGGGFGAHAHDGTANANHVVGFAQFKLPVLPGIRADLYGIDAPSGVGKISAVASIVWSLPLPIVHPYLIGGWGKYGIDKSATSESGWNVGAGVRVSLGVGVFAEYRRHEKIGRDLMTFGITF